MSDILGNDHEPEVKFEDLVGEGKKFRDPDAVAKKIVHADRHIENLESEMAELRADLKSRLTVEEMLNKISSRQIETNSEMPENKNRQEPGSEDKTKPLNLEEEVRKLVELERQKERREANLERTRSALKDRFGADYNTKLQEIANTLGIGKEFLTEMATSSPDGFLRLVDSVAAPDNKRPGLPSNDFDPLKKPNMTGRKTASYYRELRKSDPQTYFSRKVQLEMHNERIKQGDAFYD